MNVIPTYQISIIPKTIKDPVYTLVTNESIQLQGLWEEAATASYTIVLLVLANG